MSSTDIEDVEPHSFKADTFTLDIELAKPPEENIHATDFYEILRVGLQADEDTIERVYATLAERFHPDNPSTGDLETFLRLKEAYETLSNPAKRAEYNALRQDTRGAARLWLRGREFFDGVRGGQNRRLAVLCLLYRKRISTHESPGLTILDLERLTGCTREELTYALWYLCEKKWATIGEFTAYSVTAEGFDVVESKLEDQMELRALATLCYYDLPAELGDPAHLELRVWINDTRSLDIEAARTIEGAGSAADHYEILGIGPQSDEEDIERVFHTLAGRFHPDNPSTGDARTFQRVSEAYDTLSDQAKRAKYDALRQRTKESTRFRLRGREFFDGIKGEQLRRLAVLCLLYRQAACESSGLRVLDLEQLTGCTREELGSALWYLREKKWARYGEFTQYSITAAGCDFVENKLEDREAARSRPWLNPEDTQANEFIYLNQAGAALPAAPSHQTDTITPESPLTITIAPEDSDSQQIVESERTDIQAEELPDEQLAVQPESNQIEDALGPAEEDTQFEFGAESDAESEPRDVEAEEPSDENVEVAYGPIPMEEAPGIAEEVTRSEDVAEPEEQEAVGLWDWLYPEDVYGDEFVYPQESVVHPHAESQDHVSVAPQEVGYGPDQVEESSGIAEQVIRLEDAAEPRRREAAGPWAWLYPKDLYGHEFVYPHQEFTALPAAPSQQQLIAESEQREIKTEAPSEENVEVAQVPTQIEEAPGIAEEVIWFEDVADPEERGAAGSWAWLIPEDTQRDEFVNPHQANAEQPAAESQQNASVTPEPPAESEQTDIEAEVPSGKNVEVAQVPTQIEEAPGITEQGTRFVNGVEPEERAVGFWAWLFPKETYGPKFIYPHLRSAALPATDGQRPMTPENQNSQRIAESEQTDIKAEEPSDENMEVAQVETQMEEASAVEEHVTRFEDGAEPVGLEAAGSQSSLHPEDSFGNELVYLHQAIEQTDIKAEGPSDENVETAQEPIAMEEAGIAEQAGGVAVRAVKRVVFSMGGKGGVGKTNVMTGLAEWFDETRIPVTLLDLDTENKAKGSLAHFFSGRVPKINIHTPAGLDAFVDILAEDAPAILADMGAGAGQITHDWFDKMYPDVAAVGIVFTAIGVVTSDPASVESVLNWAAALQDRVDYVIVENQLTEKADFTYWRENDLAEEFRRRFQPAIIRLDCRLADLENASRNYGVTLGRIADRTAIQPELQKASLVMRAQSYRRRMFAEFDKVKELLLP